MEETSAAKNFSALFFLFHYGFFHFGYFIFLSISSANNESKLDFKLVMLNLIFLAGNTLVSTWSNVLQDREEAPALSSLFFTPYLRVAPMHLFIMIGFMWKVDKVIAGFVIKPSHLFWIFLLLKIVSDLLMHIVVQKSWRRKRPKLMEGFI